MDTMLIFGFVVLVAVAAFFIWILVSDSRAMKRSRVTQVNEISTGQTNEQPGGSEVDYGGADCFYDCMRLFQWEAKEESPCASACGLKP